MFQARPGLVYAVIQCILRFKLHEYSDFVMMRLNAESYCDKLVKQSCSMKTIPRPNLRIGPWFLHRMMKVNLTVIDVASCRTDTFCCDSNIFEMKEDVLVKTFSASHVSC